MKVFKAILLFIFGTISIICGITVASMYGGLGASYMSYGGDAYTGIQNAAAQTAQNIVALCEIVKFGFSAILIVFGGFTIVKGIDTFK